MLINDRTSASKHVPSQGPSNKALLDQGTQQRPAEAGNFFRLTFVFRPVRASEKAGEPRFKTTFDQIFDSFPASDLCEFESFILGKLATAPCSVHRLVFEDFSRVRVQCERQAISMTRFLRAWV